MPKGPQGQKRPADVIGAAIRIAKIATGEEQEDRVGLQSNGGRARADKISSARRSEIARQAAEVRWGTSSKSEG